MNENPGDTPNPLNTKPDGEPQPTAAATPAKPVAPVTPEPTAPTTSAAPADPMVRQMEPAPEPVAAAPQKKKTGLIVGIIIAALVIIGGIVAAILLLNMNKGDAVSKAMAKIMSGNAPENIRLDGTFDLAINDESSPMTNLKVTLNSDATTNSLINSSTAQITASLKDVGNISVDFSEVYAENGGALYLKVDGIKTALEDYANFINNSGTSVVEETDEIVASGEEEVVSTEMIENIAGLASLIENIDGQWLRVSAEEMSSMLGSTTEDSQSTCFVNFVSDVKNNSNSIAKMYENNPFVSSTTEGVTLASKNGGPVYKVIIDQEKLTAFVNDLQNSEIVTNLASCVGSETTTVDTDALSEAINSLPVIYVEVDNDYNFTRLAFDISDNEGATNLSTDLGFSYPTNVNVAEPTDYKDLTTVLEQLYTTTEVEDSNTLIVE